MGAITIVAVYQAFLKYPDYGTKLLSLTHNQTAYSPTLILSTLTAGAKSATYFFHKFVTKVMSQTFFFVIFS